MAEEAIIVVPNNPIITVQTPGPQGPSGAGSQFFFVHVQSVSSATWTINHNLNGNPTAVVLDSAGTQCEGTFSYPTVNQMVISFNSPFTGVAYII